MNKRPNSKLEEVKKFERDTYQQVTIWDWAARLLPLTILASVIICYFFKWHTALELIIEMSAIGFAVVCFVWWYWAIYKIAVTIKYMRKSQEEFVSLKDELRKFKQAFRNPSDR